MSAMLNTLRQMAGSEWADVYEHRDFLLSVAATLADTEHRNEKLRYRLAEIIGYCGQEGRDGEPWDTIQALARGEITLRGGGVSSEAETERGDTMRLKSREIDAHG